MKTMAETAVSKEVAIEEKRGLDVSTYEDLPKLECNGTNHQYRANDLDNSYVFVCGGDAVPDDGDGKDVKGGCSSVLPESDNAAVKDQGTDSQIEKSDAVNMEFQPLEAVEDGTIEQSNGNQPSINVTDNDVEAECSSILPESDDAGVQDQETKLDSRIEKSDAVGGEFQPLNEVAHRDIEQSNRDLPENVVDNDVEAKCSSVLPVSNDSGVQDQGIKLDSQIEKSHGDGGQFQQLNEAAHRNIEQSNGDLPTVNVDDDGKAECSTVLPKSENSAVKDQRSEVDSQFEKSEAVGGQFQPLNEAGHRKIEQSNGDLPSVNVDDADKKAECSRDLLESENSAVKDQGTEVDSQIEKSDVAEHGSIERINEDQPSINVNDNDVEADCSSMLSDDAGVEDRGTKLDSQLKKSDAVCAEFQLPNEVEHSKIEKSNGDPPSESVDYNDVEVECSSVLPESGDAGIQDQGTKLHSQIEKSDTVGGEFQPLYEVEHRNIEKNNGDPPSINVHDNDVEAECSIVLPESDDSGVHDQGTKQDFQIEQFDAVGWQFQPLNEVGRREIELCNGDPPSINVDDYNVEADCPGVLPESDDDGVQDQGTKLDSLIEKSDAVSGFQPLNEVEHRNIGTSNRDLPSVNVKCSSVLPESDAGVQDQGTKLDSQNETVDAAGGEFQPLNEVEHRNIETNNGDLPSVNVNDNDAEAECSSVLPDSYNARVQDRGTKLDFQIENSDAVGGEFQPLNEVEHRNIETSNGDPPCVNVNDNGVQPECSSVLPESDDTGVQDQGAKLDSQDENFDAVGGQFQPLNEAGHRNIELRKRDPSSVNVDDDAVEAECLSVLPESNDNEVQDKVIGLHFQIEKSDAVGGELQLNESENKNIDVQTQNYPVSNAHAPQSETEIHDAEAIGSVSSPPIDGPKSQTLEKESPGHDCGIRCPPDESISVSDSTLDAVAPMEKEPAFRVAEAHAETEVSSGKVSDCPPTIVHMKPEPEVQVHDVVISCRTEVPDSFSVNKAAVNNVLDEKATQDTQDQLHGATGNNNENAQENGSTENFQSNEISSASEVGFSATASSGREESIKNKTKPFNFLIRIPRFDDENLREQIRHARLHVDEKTKLRDAIQVQIQEKRANSQIHGIDYEYAKREARSARKLVRSKRMEIDSLQYVINKAKNALSIEDIDSQICNMEHMIQHETLPLKEEKQLIREIKQLKQLREQLSSNMGSQDEIKQAIEQREEVEDRLKILRKELDILKSSVLHAEATAAEAEEKYDDENKKVKELQAKFRAADDVRQAAYAQWQNLKKELSKKSELFYKYKDDAAVANNYAYSRDTEALYQLCTNQVENFMELWNTTFEFRRDYIKFNSRSTVRRFGTLDGRPLAPDEKPPVLPSYGDERVSRLAPTPAPIKTDLASKLQSPEVKQERIDENVIVDGKSTKKAMEFKNQIVTKEPAITVQHNGLDTLSGREHIVKEEPIKSREEIESLRREEEKRREEAEAKLKEQRRLEALEKANEARERKKRQAEKLQLRAELKTQKEAEQREKEREKRLRKKERKKAAATDANDVNNNCETALSSESSAENSKATEVKNMPSAAAPKKPQKPWLFAKQSKSKSIPPPLRNRNKKKLQQWMWVGITSFVILVLFWLGNVSVFSSVALKRRGSPFH